MVRARVEAEAAKAQRSEAFARADASAKDAGTRLQQGDYAEATRGFLEARDSYDRARRAAKAPTPTASGRAASPGTQPSAEPASAAPEPAPETTPAAPTGPLRTFVTGNTQISGARSGGGVQGFDSADVKTRRTPDFVGRLEFEMVPATVKAGDPVAVRVFVVNLGKKPVRVRSVALTVIQNGKRSSLAPSLLGREVAALQRGAVAEAKTVWADGVSDWSLDAVVTSDRDETGVARLTWE